MFEIYGRSGCSYCEQAKALLETKGKTYDYYDIQADARRLAIFKGLFPGAKTVPQIMERDASGFLIRVGGYTDLVTYLHQMS